MKIKSYIAPAVFLRQQPQNLASIPWGDELKLSGHRAVWWCVAAAAVVVFAWLVPL